MQKLKINYEAKITIAVFALFLAFYSVSAKNLLDSSVIGKWQVTAVDTSETDTLWMHFEDDNTVLLTGKMGGSDVGMQGYYTVEYKQDLVLVNLVLNPQSGEEESALLFLVFKPYTGNSFQAYFHADPEHNDPSTYEEAKNGTGSEVVFAKVVR